MGGLFFVVVTSRLLTLKHEQSGKRRKEKVWRARYLDLSGMVYDNQPQENDCRKAYQAF